MDSVIIFALPGNEKMASRLALRMGCKTGQVNIHHFPDGEICVNVDTSVGGKEVFIVASLDHPDEKFFALYFLAKTLKEFGAYSIRLVAPYLAYMRQDKRFQPGDSVTAGLFAHLLSTFVDELITIDPHLNRHHSLSEFYFIPTRTLHAAPLIAKWIQNNSPDALLVGPDEESEQWVADVAKRSQKPYIVLKKIRKGDKKVQIKMPDVLKWKNQTPVLIDDIIATAGTMIEAINQLKNAGHQNPVCIGVHGLFTGNAFQRLSATGAKIVTCNTIPHQTNAIDVTRLIAAGIQTSVDQCLV